MKKIAMLLMVMAIVVSCSSTMKDKMDEGNYLYPVKVKVHILEWRTFQGIKTELGFDDRVIGFAVTNTERTETTIVVPLPYTEGSKIDNWAEFQLVVGHELLHAMQRQNPSIVQFPNPDKMD